MANFHAIAIRSLGCVGIVTGSLVMFAGSAANASQSPTIKVIKPLASFPDPAAQPGDAFGGSVSEDGTSAIVGAPGTDDSAGAAYIYVKGATGWPTSPTVTLLDPSGGPNLFGSSVSISGNYAIVGADEANGGAGAVYVYSYSGSVWSTTPTATISGQSGTEQGFGFSVSMYDGGNPAPEAIVGSSNETAANVYTGNVSEWPAGPTRYLSPEFGGDPGYSVGIVGDIAIVGAPHSNVTGFAYLYIANQKGWVGSVKTVALNSGSRGSTEFGDSVSTTGSAVIVGAMGQHNGHGAAYAYSTARPPSDHPTAIFRIRHSEDGFGASVALTGRTAVVSNTANVVYVFQESRDGWVTQPTATLRDPGAPSGAMFGASMSAAANNSVLVGAPGTEDGSGAAYVYHA